MNKIIKILGVVALVSAIGCRGMEGPKNVIWIAFAAEDPGVVLPISESAAQKSPVLKEQINRGFGSSKEKPIIVPERISSQLNAPMIFGEPFMALIELLEKQSDNEVKVAIAQMRSPLFPKYIELAQYLQLPDIEYFLKDQLYHLWLTNEGPDLKIENRLVDPVQIRFKLRGFSKPFMLKEPLKNKEVRALGLIGQMEWIEIMDPQTNSWIKFDENYLNGLRSKLRYIKDLVYLIKIENRYELQPVSSAREAAGEQGD